jgi:hypothetical protein
MGGACGVHGGDEGCIQHFGWVVWREETTRKTLTLMGGQH